jgi:hypothetical protein
MSKISQREMRQGIVVDGGLRDVSSVTSWYRADHFKSEEAARGAFELAYQQGMDGMGESVAAWMGMNEVEFDTWMRRKALPSKK